MANQRDIERFFEGTGVEVEDYSRAGGLLVLVTEGDDGKEKELVIKALDESKLGVQTGRRH